MLLEDSNHKLHASMAAEVGLPVELKHQDALIEDGSIILLQAILNDVVEEPHTSRAQQRPHM